jgi:aminoglycoside 6'-N-acetyltransferase I
MHGMIIRPAEVGDQEAWLELRRSLWPHSRHDHSAEITEYFRDPPGRWICLLAEKKGAGILGFLEVGLRDYAEGCLTSPVGYLEGIYVRAEWRRRGVGRGLVRAGEEWARTVGCTEMASDRELINDESGAFHSSVGYSEVERIVCYRRPL